jgi:hypothetical protein
MKRSVFLSLLLTAVVVSVTALVLVGCEDMTATGVTATPLSLSTTSSSLSTLVSGEMVGSTTTLSGTPGGAAPPSGTPGGAAPPTGTPAVATTTTAASVELGEPPLDLTPTRYEETDSHLLWDGSWLDWAGSNVSGGSARVASHAGSAVTIKFTGTNMIWIGTMGIDYGVATVSVDGGYPETVDLYGDGTYRDQAKMWGSGTLAFDTHKVRIECTGLGNSTNPAGTLVVVDAFDVIGSLE